MKKGIYALIVSSVCCIACNKNYVPTETGSINGQPAVTLYGSSRLPSDFMFINTSLKELSYNGQILNYLYSSGNTIFIEYNNFLQAKGTLDTVAPITLTINSTSSIAFGSSLYVAK